MAVVPLPHPDSTVPREERPVLAGPGGGGPLRPNRLDTHTVNTSPPAFPLRDADGECEPLPHRAQAAKQQCSNKTPFSDIPTFRCDKDVPLGTGLRANSLSQIRTQPKQCLMHHFRHPFRYLFYPPPTPPVMPAEALHMQGLQGLQ